MKNLIFLLSLFFLNAACSDKRDSDRTEVGVSFTDSLLKTGGVRFIRLENGHQIWTKRVGNGPVKVLLLHDGPGLSHDYLQCFEDFIAGTGIELYYFDQLGCGNSDNPADTGFWNISRFSEEVEEVRKGLGLEQFYLFGHGWGGMLAMEYLISYQDNLKGVVISNAAASLNQKYRTAVLKRCLSPAEFKILDSLCRNSRFSDPAYPTLLYSRFYNQSFCRLNPWPAPLLTSISKSNQGLHRHMLGENVLDFNGNLAFWQRWDTLQTLSAPSLIIGGLKDDVNPEELREMGRRMPNSRVVLCPDAGRMSMYDNQPMYFKELLRFLKEVDEGTFHPDPLPDS
jgi:proline iminopeptidase